MIEKKATKKDQRRAAHLEIATLIFHSMMDGNFGRSGSVARQIARRNFIRHLKFSGMSEDEFFKQDEE